eukprot:7797092-Pyramimonas_sp.AAC.1
MARRPDLAPTQGPFSRILCLFSHFLRRTLGQRRGILPASAPARRGGRMVPRRPLSSMNDAP